MPGAIRPGVIYFTDNGVGRGTAMVADLDNPGQAPRVIGPSMLNSGASAHYRYAMLPVELESAGIDRYVAA